MKISREQVEHIAELAKLSLSEEEIAMFAGQLSTMLGYFENLSELDTSAISPTASVLPLDSVTRPDETAPSLPTEAALANAPDAVDGQFQVAAVLDESP